MFKRLRWRLTATYIGLVILAMLVLGLFLMSSLKGYFYNNLETRLESQALLASRLIKETKSDWNFDFMESQADKISSDVGARVTIINIAGKVLGDSEEFAPQMESHINRPEIQRTMNKKEGMAIRYSSTLDKDMMYVAVPITENGKTSGYMRLAVPITETRQAFSKLWSVVTAAVLVAVFCTIVISFVLSKMVTGPVEKLMEFTRRVSRGDFDFRAQVKSNDEIGELAGALNHMAATIKEKVRLISEGKNRLETVLTNMTSGVIFINGKRQVDLVNPAAERFLSFTGEGSKGVVHDALIKHPELSAAIDNALKSCGALEREIKIENPEEAALQVVISPIHNNKGDCIGVVAVLHDITERRKVERMRKDFVGNVSHELKTPVTSIKGFTETLLDGAIDDTETNREFVEIIDKEADRLKRVIQDLLELSRLEGKQVKLNFKPEDLSSIIRSTVQNLSGQIKSKNLNVQIELPEKTVIAAVDRDIVEQILVNLVDNAVKYSPAGGVIEIAVEEREKDVVVRVRDTGMGIPPEDIGRVFERFYRVDKTRSRDQGGKGLGLSIVKHLVDIHGGTVGVTSKQGEGSEFFFALPKNCY